MFSERLGSLSENRWQCHTTFFNTNGVCLFLGHKLGHWIAHTLCFFHLTMPGWSIEGCSKRKDSQATGFVHLYIVYTVSLETPPRKRDVTRATDHERHQNKAPRVTPPPPGRSHGQRYPRISSLPRETLATIELRAPLYSRTGLLNDGETLLHPKCRRNITSFFSSFNNRCLSRPGQ